MGHLVDDLLDLARIEAGHIVMAEQPVALSGLLQEVRGEDGSEG